MDQYTLPSRTYLDMLHDQKVLDFLEAKKPGYTLNRSPQFDKATLAKIGIDYLETDLPSGYLKLQERDFIVEEITQKGSILTIDAPKSNNDDFGFILPGMAVFSATLIKKSMSTVEAVERIAEALNISLNCIRYAGIKDAKAITAQNITISRINRDDLAKLDNLSGIILKDWKLVTDPIDVGKLQGNRFTLTIRTDKKIDDVKFKQKIEDIQNRGFLNFFSFQRFGSRLINVALGELILKKRYEEALKLYMTSRGDYESQYFRDLRSYMDKNWGRWDNIIKVLKPFKYIFYYENALAHYLEKNPTNFPGALTLIKSQTSLFVYAYFSYYFNKLLSIYAMQKLDLPPTLPLLRPFPHIQNLYYKYFSPETFQELEFSNQLPFLMIKKEYDIPTAIKPHISSYKIIERMAVLEFSLGKGAYATTFLQSLFDLYQGNPKPAWLDETTIDPKKILGYESIETIEKLFKTPNTHHINHKEE